MIQTTICKSNSSQVVKLPKEVALPENVKQVDIVAVGNRRIISPAGTAWDEWFENDSASSDFMKERSKPVIQSRTPFDA